MNPVFKINLEQTLDSGAEIMLELGCGAKKKAGRIGIDKIDMPSVDIVADMEEGLGFLPNRCVDRIYSNSFLEHVNNFEMLMREMLRVLKKDGRAHIFVPHFSNPYYYSDFTHIRTFGLYSFFYFVEPEFQLKRKVPTFYTDIRISIHSVKLIFTSPFWLRKRLKKCFGSLVNLNSGMQEYYEENLCYMVPCDGISVVFGPAEK